MNGKARYQVFVSSTYTDLVTERQAVMSALLQLGALPAGMELFPAADDEAWTLIKRVIDESDYYLLVIGGRYGSVDAEGLSFTEREYDYATSQHKPVMAFLHQNPEELPFKVSEGDPAAREKLVAFRNSVQGAKHVKYWTSAEDLAGKIALSFGTFTQSYPSAGWVRGDAGDSPETLRKLAKVQERNAELEGRLHDRAVEPPPGATGLADRDERLTFEATISIEIKNLDWQSGISSKQSQAMEISISWNEILSALGPAMIDEANQHELASRFTNAVKKLNTVEATARARAWLGGQVPPSKLSGYVKGKRSTGVIFTASVITNLNDFETALLQLEALGLIEQGSKKRPPSDRSTYWTLTPWGRTRLTGLRAVRSGTTRPPEKDESAFESSGEIHQSRL